MLVKSAVLAMGFREISDNRPDYDTFLPCPLGTFSNSSSRGTDGCTECPPGMLDLPRSASFRGNSTPRKLACRLVFPTEESTMLKLILNKNSAPLVISFFKKRVLTETASNDSHDQTL